MKGWKRVLGFIAVFGLVAATSAATTSMLVTQSIARIGGYWTTSVQFDSLTGGGAGGRVIIAMVGGTTDTLLAGDVVYWSDTNKVTKSATLANYSMIAGVVVGGQRTSPPLQALMSSSDVGTVVATTGQRVVLCKQCRAWMKSSNNAAWIAGRRVLPSDSIAGRLDTSLTASVIDTFYRMVGRTVGAASALGTVLVDVNIK